MRAWLAANPGWLLILDGADTGDAAEAASALLLRAVPGHILITSRQAQWAPNVLAVAPLSPTDGARLLIDRTGLAERRQ